MYRIIIFFVAFMLACNSDKSSSVNVTDPHVPPVIEEPDPLELSVKYLVFQDGEQVKFFNGSKEKIYGKFNTQRNGRIQERLIYL